MFLTHTEKTEIWNALILRLCNAEILPHSFRLEARKYGIADDEITAAIREHSAECADRINAGPVPFKSGLYQG